METALWENAFYRNLRTWAQRPAVTQTLGVAACSCDPGAGRGLQADPRDSELLVQGEIVSRADIERVMKVETQVHLWSLRVHIRTHTQTHSNIYKHTHTNIYSAMFISSTYCSLNLSEIISIELDNQVFLNFVFYFVRSPFHLFCL